jgi:hypothetical protein
MMDKFVVTGWSSGPRFTTFRPVVRPGTIADALLLGILTLATCCLASCGTVNAGSARAPVILVNNFGRSTSGYVIDAGGRIAPTGTLKFPMAEVDVATDAKADSTGNIYVANWSSVDERNDSIVIFSAGSSGKATPIATIAGKATGLNRHITAIAIDASGNIFAGNVGHGRTPPSTLCVPGQSAEANDASVTAYQSGSSGDVKPIAAISGPCTGIQAPLSLAVDSKENLYVANGKGIVVFPPHSNGNIEPSAVIAGPRTGLTGVRSIALDAGDNLFALNERPNEVLVFRAHSTGDVAPMAKISGPKTGLDRFEGKIAVDSSGNLFAGGTDLYQKIKIIVFAPGSNGDAQPLASVTYHWSPDVWAYGIVGTTALLLGFPE